jgi:hypothetical protein
MIVRDVGSPDVVAEKLNKKLAAIPEEVLGPFDMMDLFFWVDCLRCMANDAREVRK